MQRVHCVLALVCWLLLFAIAYTMLHAVQLGQLARAAQAS